MVYEWVKKIPHCNPACKKNPFRNIWEPTVVCSDRSCVIFTSYAAVLPLPKCKVASCNIVDCNLHLHFAKVSTFISCNKENQKEFLKFILYLKCHCSYPLLFDKISVKCLVLSKRSDLLWI